METLCCKSGLRHIVLVEERGNLAGMGMFEDRGGELDEDKDWDGDGNGDGVG